MKKAYVLVAVISMALGGFMAARPASAVEICQQCVNDYCLPTINPSGGGAACRQLREGGCRMTSHCRAQPPFTP